MLHPPSSQKQTWFSLLWLGLALVLSAFATNGRWDIALAGWLFPLFLLRFTRTHKPAAGFFAAFLVYSLSSFVWHYQTLNQPMSFFLIVLLITAAFMALPYLFDRLLTPRWNGRWVSTLIFPTSYVLIDFLRSLVSPLGSIGSLAYTQYGNLPLLQLLSVTGLSGIIFLMTWFASTVNWAWQRQWKWSKISAGTQLYAGLLALVLLGGSLRLVLPQPMTSTVRVASMVLSQQTQDRAMKQDENAYNTVFTGQFTQADRQAFRVAFAPWQDELFTRTQSEARNGSKIIAWPELSLYVLEEDLPLLIARGEHTAQQSQVYLEMGIGVALHQAPFTANISLLFDPQGRLLWTYHKAHPVPGMDPSTPGNGVLHVVGTPYGRLSTLICYDADFPALSQQAGRQQVAIMLDPSGDWQAIDPWHSYNAVYRSIENGYALVRSTNAGLSLTVDAQGRVLGEKDFFNGGSQVSIAQVPVKGTATLYTLLGDAFAYLCIASLCVLIVLSLLVS